MAHQRISAVHIFCLPFSGKSSEYYFRLLRNCIGQLVVEDLV